MGALSIVAGQAQLSSSAYRALGQPDLRENGVNMVQGSELFGPGGVALDASGGQLHLYVADTGNHRVLAWQDARSMQNGAPATLVLGQPDFQHVSPLGIGVKGLTFPLSVAVDPATGNLYVADFGNSRVVRFTKPFANPTRVEPDAVYGQPNFNNGRANTGGISDHSMSGPRAVAFDSLGNLWVVDASNHRVLRFPAAVLDATNPSADLVIGQKGFTTGGANQSSNAVSASGFDTPAGLALDQQNNLYVSDFKNARILRFAAPLATGEAATLVLGQSQFTTKTAPPQASASTLGGPQGLTVDGAGSLYAAVPGDNRILIFAAAAGLASGAPATGVLGQQSFTTTQANIGVFPRASASTLSGATDVKVDGNGNVFAVDAGNNRVLSVPANSKSAAVVWGQPNLNANGVNEIKPGSISAPSKMAIDYSQSPFALYVSDTNNHRVLIWRDAVHFSTGAPADLAIGQPDLVTALPNVDSNGSAAPTKTSLWAPVGVVLDSSGSLYVADSGNNRVLRFPRPVSQSGRITPDAVFGQASFNSSDSAAVSASSLKAPTGLALGPNGNLFIADWGNNRVLEFPSGAPSGAAAVRVYGQTNFTTGAAPKTPSAQSLAAPEGLCVDAAYNLYVADLGSNRVVLYSDTKDAPASGISASIVIGQDGFNLAVAGGANHLKGPFDVALDPGGQIWVSDTGNNRVVRFPSLIQLPIAGAVATAVVGQPNLTGGAPNFNSTDGLATPEGLFAPAGILFDRRGTLYVGDTGNNRVVHFLRPAAVVNAAHFLAGVAVAPGGLVSLFGAGLSDDSGGASALPLPKSLASREVVVNDQIPAALLYLSPAQINLELPSTSPLGLQRIAVRVADTQELVAGGSVLVATSSPGFFTLNQDGKGQGAILNQDGRPNGPSTPAAKGSVVQLFGTGQGPVNPTPDDGAAAPSSPLAATVATPTSDGAACLNNQPSVCVAVGSTLGEIQFSGLAPGFVGLWQINVKIPQNALSGSAVPVRAVINGTPSNTIVVAIQ